MGESAQVTRTREFLDTFARGELDALGEFFSDDVVWHVAGKHPLSGDYVGRDALIGYFKRANRESGGSLKLAPSGILANEERVAARWRSASTRTASTASPGFSTTISAPTTRFTREADRPVGAAL